MAVLAVALLPAGCGNSESASAAPTTAPVAEQSVTKCRDLLAQNWQPPATDPDLNWNRETGIVEVHVGEETLVLDVHRDQDCQKLPTIGPLIVRGLADEKSY